MRTFISLSLLTLTVAGCDGTGRTDLLQPDANVESVTPNQEWAPVLSPAAFIPGGTNQFFPLVAGTILRYESESEDGLELGVVHITAQIKSILGINTRVVHDRVYLDANENGLPDGTPCAPPAPGFTAELIEETFDWYATHNDGTVWYLGEDSREFDNCVQVSTAGSWEAGVAGAFPGIIMMASPVVGQSYRQEFAAGIAEDWAKVLHLGRAVSVPYGDLTGCLETMDWTYLDPGNREHKFYCPGLGLALEIRPNGGRVLNQLVAKSP